VYIFHFGAHTVLCGGICGPLAETIDREEINPLKSEEKKLDRSNNQLTNQRWPFASRSLSHTTMTDIPLLVYLYINAICTPAISSHQPVHETIIRQRTSRQRCPAAAGVRERVGRRSGERGLARELRRD
jgi:hypothetical protein